MRWRQIVPTAALAAVAGYLTLQRGASLLTATAAAVGLYIVLRWLTAWAFRTRYWYHHEGRNGRTCPSCRRTIYRRPGDWVLRCYGCGWTAGWPGTRLLTRSVPTQQLRRTVSVSGLLIVLLAASVVAVPSTPTGSVSGGGDVEIEAGGYNHTTTEAAFIERLNSVRADRGLQPVARRDELAAMGRVQAENMREHSYLGHEQPDGTTIEDRYRERGLLPECRLNKEDGTYYPGAEVAATGYVDRDVRVSGSGEVVGVYSEDDLADYLVKLWLNSPPHREILLHPEADEVGLGVATAADDKMYAAAEFC